MSPKHTLQQPYQIAKQEQHHHQTASASSPETNTRAIFLLAAQKPPHGIYCNPFYAHAGHGTIYTPSPSSTGAAAALSHSPLQHYPYLPNSGIHGMDFDPSERYLYSADMWSNKIWCHKKVRPAGSRRK